MTKRPKQKNDALLELPSSGRADHVYLFADTLLAGDEEEKEPEQTESWVVFRVGLQTYALPVTDTHEITRVESITRVPNAPPLVRGVTNLRGRVIPVVDLHRRFGLEAATIEADSRILVLSSKGRMIGALVDSVDSVARLLPSQMETAEDKGDHESSAVVAFYQWNGERLRLLDVETTLSVVDAHQKDD